MNRSRSVIFVDHTSVLAGGERSLLAVATNLPEWQVTVVLGADGPLADELAAAGVETTVVVIPMARLAAVGRRDSGPLASAISAVALLRWSWRLRRELRQAEPAVVVANSLKSGVATWLATRRSSSAVVWSIRDRLAPDYLGVLPRSLLRLLLGHGPDVVIANSAATAATCGAATSVEVIPPSVTPLVVTPPVDDHPLVFAVLGRLAPWKGQHLAISAFARAFPDDDVELRIIGGPLFGETDYLLRLEDQVAQLGLERRIAFTGHLDDVAPALEGVHALVLPSVLPEPFGRSLVEAMGAGIAVIASNAGGPTEFIEDGVNGLLVTIDDEAGLAAAMNRLANPELRAKLAAAGRSTAERYEPRSLAQLWSEALDRSAAS